MINSNTTANAMHSPLYPKLLPRLEASTLSGRVLWAHGQRRRFVRRTTVEMVDNLSCSPSYVEMVGSNLDYVNMWLRRGRHWLIVLTER